MKLYRVITYFTPLVLSFFFSSVQHQFAFIHVRSSPLKRNYDTQHIKLRLDFNESERSLSGNATLTIIPTDTNFSRCFFHAKDMDIRDIRLNNNVPLDFSADSEKVVITFPRKYQSRDTLLISIDYFTIPKRGFYFHEPTPESPDRHYQIYSHSEPVDARYWFPCYDEPDDKVTSEVIATVNANYELLSNGRLIEILDNPSLKQKTYHWYQDKPHSTYLISVVAGDYHVINEETEGLSLQYYTYKDKIEATRYTFSKTPAMMKLFSQKFKYPFPWDKYTQIVVDDYQARGMEHTSAATLIANSVLDRRSLIDLNSDELIAHELAHQWFGDLVTCSDWSHLWLNEGLATNAEIIFIENTAGSEEAQYEIIQQQQLYIDLEDNDFRQPIVYTSYGDPEEMFNHISYQKASMVLQMLRYLIGDSLYFQSLSNFLHSYQFQAVETENFISAVEQTSNQDLSWFFEQWLYQGGHPEFVVSYVWKPDSHLVVLDVTQVQQDSFNLVPVFQMPVDIEIVTPSEKHLEQRFIKNRSETMRFHVNQKPLMVRFDKYNHILKSIQFIKTQSEAIYQLLHDDDLRGRFEAIRQLEQNTIDSTETIDVLKTALLQDSFWAMRQKAAMALEQFPLEKVKNYYLAAVNDAHPKVRAVCIRNLGDLQDPDLCRLFRSIASSDSSYWVVAEALYALMQIPDSLNYEFLFDFIAVESYNDMVETAAFEGFREIKDKRSIPIAIKLSSDMSLSFNHRYAAFRLLEEIGIGDPEVEATLIKLLSEHDETLLKKIIQILGKFKSGSALHALQELEQKNLSDSVRRRLIYAIKRIEESM